jgi:hypothetical protein
VVGSVRDGLLEVRSHHDPNRRLRWWMRDPEKGGGESVAGSHVLVAVGRIGRLVAGSMVVEAAAGVAAAAEEPVLGPTPLVLEEVEAEEVVEAEEAV